jgi:DNA-binding Lrp family transcriptional regulator
MTQKTSLDVYKRIIASGLISKRRKEIVEILWEHTALTGNQISKIHKEKHNTNSFSENVKNRITELEQMGVISIVGIVACPLTKNQVNLYALSGNLPVKLEVKQTKKQKVDNIKKQIVEIGKMLPDGEAKNLLRSVYWDLEKI